MFFGRRPGPRALGLGFFSLLLAHHTNAVHRGNRFKLDVDNNLILPIFLLYFFFSTLEHREDVLMQDKKNEKNKIIHLAELKIIIQSVWRVCVCVCVKRIHFTRTRVNNT